MSEIKENKILLSEVEKNKIIEKSVKFIKHAQNGVGEIESYRYDDYQKSHKLKVLFPTLDLFEDDVKEPSYIWIHSEGLSIPVEINQEDGSILTAEQIEEKKKKEEYDAAKYLRDVSYKDTQTRSKESLETVGALPDESSGFADEEG